MRMWLRYFVERHTEKKMRNLQTNTYIHQLTHDYIRHYARLSNVFVKKKSGRIYKCIIEYCEAACRSLPINRLVIFQSISISFSIYYTKNVVINKCSRSSFKKWPQFVAWNIVNVWTIWSSLYRDHLTNRIYQRHLNIPPNDSTLESPEYSLHKIQI